jgi:DNA-binding response OmpR family regulator
VDGRAPSIEGLRATSVRILVVEDEGSIADLVTLYLHADGFRTEHVADGSAALTAIERERPILVILDLMLPGIDGIEVCRRVRARDPHLPILMLTARSEEPDRILGFDVGADDYLAKPFSPRELVRRVRALLRRAGIEQPTPRRTGRLELGALVVDAARHEVLVDGDPVELTPREFTLLAHLAERPGVVFERASLLTEAWGYVQAIDSRTVDSHVKTLRRKLGAAGQLVETVRGVGYRLADRGARDA